MAKKRRGKGKRRGNRLLSQAMLEANLATAPEESALKQLLREARVTLDSSVRSEKGAADSLRAALQEAKPEMSRAYARSGAQYGQAQKMLSADLRGLSSAADPFKAAAAGENAGATRRLSDAAGESMREIDARQVGAAQGRAYAVRHLNEQYHGDISKLGSRYQDLQREKGERAQVSYGKLVTAAEKEAAKEADAAAGRAVTRRGQDLTRRGQDLSHQDRVEAGRRADAKERRQAAKDRREGGGKGGKPKEGHMLGRKGFTDTQVRANRDKILHLAGVAKDHRGKGFAWLLRNAREKHPPLLARIAVERGYYGGVSRGLARRALSEYGVRVKVRRSRGPRRGPRGSLG